ncbi:flagellar export chaperone FliS [Gemmatimonas sp.]|uniref:flagellar export chaperone FliS n=1 Tax=Gemmatimonas sp. TaxID=1962908 RepID=UPI0022C1C2FA|nr:flagellar export chaperone FliS [Gemmatimonas sp.]MCZ8203888.1 flagellar export chaperone FliS [Gemmatimonas sp.]
MSYASQSSSYREMEIHAASPHKLVVIVFEQLVVNLERARIAMERNDVELRLTSLRRARDIVTELLGTLDFEQGGALANQLADLYQYLLYELVDIGQRGDVHVMRKLVNIASLLRDGFVGAAEQLASEKAARKSA